MRDRLRQLLTKKKATKCKAACSPPKSPAESLPSNANSDSKTTTSSHSAPRSNTPLSTASTVLLDNRDQRDLDALLEFIEGGQNGKRDNKKAEKKARQKQRKVRILRNNKVYNSSINTWPFRYCIVVYFCTMSTFRPRFWSLSILFISYTQNYLDGGYSMWKFIHCKLSLYFSLLNTLLVII